MALKLTPELSAALQSIGHKPLTVIDPNTNQVYVLVDQGEHQRAMDALRRHEDQQALRDGIADLEAGRVSVADVALDRIESRLRARHSQ